MIATKKQLVDEYAFCCGLTIHVRNIGIGLGDIRKLEFLEKNACVLHYRISSINQNVFQDLILDLVCNEQSS